MRPTPVRHAGRDELAVTANALILMDCLTMDPLCLNNTRIESYMDLLALIRTGRPAIADGLHVNPGDFDSGGESLRDVASHEGWQLGVLVIRGRLSGRSNGIAHETRYSGKVPRAPAHAVGAAAAASELDAVQLSCGGTLVVGVPRGTRIATP